MHCHLQKVDDKMTPACLSEVDGRVQVRRYICGHLASFLRLESVSLDNDVIFNDVIDRHHHRCQQRSDMDQHDDEMHEGQREQTAIVEDRRLLPVDTVDALSLIHISEPTRPY